MDSNVSIRALEILCSRLCHDLVGPIGAINNGVELLDEAGDSGGEAMDLIADSAESAAARLRLYRLALGAAGGQGVLSGAEGRQALEGWFRGGRVRLEWAVPALESPPPGLVKLSILAALMAEEGLPRGGIVRIDGGDRALRISANGAGCGLRPEMRQALDGAIADADLSPRSILSFVVPRFAAAYGLEFAVPGDGGQGALTFTITPRTSVAVG